MTALFRFIDAGCDASGRTYSFTLNSGEARQLHLPGDTEKEAMISLAIGETKPGKGRIEMVQGDRRRSGIAATGPSGERRSRNEPAPVTWQPLSLTRPGRVVWVAGNGGLVSNLKIWENVTLPLWYNARRDVVQTEQNVIYWLGVLGMEQNEYAGFMAAMPDALDPWQRKLAGLLRALLQMPQVLVVDAALFENLEDRSVQSWINALQDYAAAGRSVLALADKATPLPWKKLDEVQV